MLQRRIQEEGSSSPSPLSTHSIVVMEAIEEEEDDEGERRVISSLITL
jgi:hypothetical protein